jgi:hypothetical protein
VSTVAPAAGLPVDVFAYDETSDVTTRVTACWSKERQRWVLEPEGAGPAP